MLDNNSALAWFLFNFNKILIKFEIYLDMETLFKDFKIWYFYISCFHSYLSDKMF